MSIQREQRPAAGQRSISRSRRYFGFIANNNLRKEVYLLEPLVESESNSEYRYLLARCYSAMSSVSPPHEREAYVARANAVLEALVEASAECRRLQV